jgi:hypothetical protein
VLETHALAPREHDGARAVLRLDEAHRLELREGRAEREAVHPERGGELALRGKLRAGLDAPGDHVRAEAGHDRVDHGRAGDRRKSGVFGGAGEVVHDDWVIQWFNH